MTEYTLEGEAGAFAGLTGASEGQTARAERGVRAGRIVNAIAAVLMVLWSWEWLPPMVAGVRAQTELGQNGLTQAPSAHQVFEVLFVAAHWGVKWLPGVVVVGLLAVAARRLVRHWL